jgi:hypothetical protein
MIANQSKYMIIGNSRIPNREEIATSPNVKIYSVKSELPVWFRTYNGRRIIKVYGTTLYQMLSDVSGQNMYVYDQDTPLQATIHSNIALYSNTGRIIDEIPKPVNPHYENPTNDDNPETFWIPEAPLKLNSNTDDIYGSYVSTVNNFYNVKTYEYTDPAITHLEFWFKNRYGNTIPIYYIKKDVQYEEGIEVGANYRYVFLMFKIECELLTL